MLLLAVFGSNCTTFMSYNFFSVQSSLSHFACLQGDSTYIGLDWFYILRARAKKTLEIFCTKSDSCACGFLNSQIYWQLLHRMISRLASLANCMRYSVSVLLHMYPVSIFHFRKHFSICKQASSHPRICV